jgi:hypothetical protein
MRNLKEIVRVKVTDKRTIVISHNEQEDKIIIGQQIHTVDEEGKPMNFFLKGALNIPAEMLPKVSEAINEAIDELDI